MRDHFHKLKEGLLCQEFGVNRIRDIEHYKTVAQSCAELEGAIAVLSDLRERCSYLYYGSFAQTLGLESKEGNVDDIWEQEVMDHIRPEDLDLKLIQELRFFHFVLRQPAAKRGGYCLVQPMMMHDRHGKWYSVIHRIRYVPTETGQLGLSFCLYHPMDGCETIFILEMATGRHLPLPSTEETPILTEREKTILGCVDRGFSSKEIADELSISIHTVSRHRQNIMEKLQARGSIEACRLARRLHLL